MIVSSIVGGQTLQEKLETEICKCFDQQISIFNESKNLDSFDQCFDLPFQKFQKELEQEAVNKKVDTTANNAYELGLEYGRQLFNDMQKGLIFNCDSYYEIMQVIGDTMYKNMSNGVSQRSLDSLSLLVKEYPSDDILLWKRGTHNLGLDNVNKAQEDFLECIRINPNNEIAKFCLGWTYDLQENLEPAIKYYEESLNANSNIGYFQEIGRINLLILQRKKDK